MISEYCKVCKLFETCDKPKTCSCENIQPIVSFKCEHKQKSY